MIEKMLKVTVVTTSNSHVKTLKDLRVLGVIHIEGVQKSVASQTTLAIAKEIEITDKAIFALSDDHDRKETHIYRDIHPKNLTEKLAQVITDNDSYKKEIDALKKERESLKPWGEFSYETIDKIESASYNLYLCTAPEKQLINYLDKGFVEKISSFKGQVNFVIISKDKYKKEELPLATLPSHRLSISDINFKIAELNIKILENKEVIQDMVESIASIKEYKIFLEEKLEFSTNIDTMGDKQNLKYITGFVPKKHEKLLLYEAKKRGWAILFENPSESDMVPTSMNVPKIFSLAKPIFEFVGLYPGYNEWDVSGCFLIFFGIFFSMIINDAGYATLFIVITLALKYAYGKNSRIRQSLNLFLYLSTLTFIWGMLNGQYFSIPSEHLPIKLHGIKFFTALSTSNQHIQLICFLLAAIHLSFARVWKAYIMISSSKIGKALGQIGWAFIIWGNYLIAKHLIVTPDISLPKITFYLYATGIILVFVFFVHWREPIALFETPLSLIGSFIDVLSYIRLFAVGIASVYIAENFNNMGVQIVSISEWLIPFGLLIIVAGHLLNIALGLMAVLVHGIRLNTLEFSNHMDLKWAGYKYLPLKKKLYHLKKKKNINAQLI